MDRDTLRWQLRFDDIEVDVAAAKYMRSLMTFGQWRFLLIGEPDDAIVENSKPTSAVQGYLDRLRRLRRWISSNMQRAGEIAPGVRSSFEAIVVVGRRPQPGSPEQSQLRTVNDEMLDAQIRTFDWLLDAVMEKKDDNR
jgi:hypothetical protein